MDFETIKGSELLSRQELDIFNLPPTDASIVQSSYYVFTPQSSVKDEYSPIVITVPPCGNKYIDMRNSFLYVKCRLLESNDKKLIDADLVSPSNLFLYSMFKTFILSANGTVIDDSHFYGYKSVIEQTLLYSEEEKKTRMNNSLFFKNTGGVNNWDLNKNSGFKKRYEIAKASKIFEMLGPISTGLAQQTR